MKDKIGNAVPVLRSGVVSSMIEGPGIFFVIMKPMTL